MIEPIYVRCSQDDQHNLIWLSFQKLQGKRLQLSFCQIWLPPAACMHASSMDANGNASFLLLLQIEDGLAMHAIEQRRPTDCNDDSSSVSMIIIYQAATA
jgi:hypothetical protein